ncbi:TRAP transporter large permease [Succinatimonas hippei]|uniref:TRAP transporter large permease n=1 Tax=Succinatimonas hippei TaxID=626938 RepID=UPI0023F80021|nr:TRAP transporter large permease [Succinatimonas hippei]
MESFLQMMGIFIFTLFLGFPIAISIGLSITFALILSGIPIGFVAQMCFAGLDNYTYLAIPMFVLTGYLMETGGLSQRLVNFASSLIGNVTGGLGIVTVIACMFFAAISGSSPATVAAIGSMMIPSMVRKGYSPEFSGALTSASGSLGILIPPSIPMIIYAVTAEVSIGEIFTAGFIPGFLVGFGLMVVVYFVAKKRGYTGDGQKFSVARVITSFRQAVWSLLTPVIILGGIYCGIFTATEASIVAVFYALIIGLFVHRELKFKDIAPIIVKAAITTGTVIIILGFATAFARYITMMQVPQLIGEAILQVTNNATIILCFFVVLILISGMFIETAAQILIYTPLFLPILTELGVSPIHFGIILIIGTELGLITPPVGVNLFVAQGITGAKISKMSMQILPFVFSMLICQLLLVFIPKIVTILPDLVYR